jgi:hypothetical protein
LFEEQPLNNPAISVSAIKLIIVLPFFMFLRPLSSI